MSVQDVVDYVLQSPQNTNPTILKQMIRENSSSSGGGDTFVVHGTVTPPTQEGEEPSLTVQESINDIISAYESNKIVILSIDGHAIKFFCTDCNSSEEFIEFAGYMYGNETNSNIQLTQTKIMYTDGAWVAEDFNASVSTKQGVTIVNATKSGGTTTLDTTASKIASAMSFNEAFIHKKTGSMFNNETKSYRITYIKVAGGAFEIHATDGTDVLKFYASSGTAYPTDEAPSEDSQPAEK